MISKNPQSRLRFQAFELDVSTGELRKNGRRIRLQDQPARLLALLASRRGEVVTREEIQAALWADGEFVEFEHAINTAIRKIRAVLDDDRNQPRMIETLPRKGYRFIAPVEVIDPLRSREVTPVAAGPVDEETLENQFALPLGVSRVLFLVIQLGYLAIYIAVLRYLDELGPALNYIGLGRNSGWIIPAVMIAAMCGIAIRIYWLASVGWKHPAGGFKFRRMFPYLLTFDGAWAASPLLVAVAIGWGLALASVAGMAHLPFAQRTLVRSIYRHPEKPQDQSHK